MKNAILKLKGDTDLKDEVIDIILSDSEGYDDIKDFFHDLRCQSGFISELTYYNQTHAFYDKFYDDIEELRVDFEDSIGEPINIRGDLKNFFAWFAFEEVANQIYNELYE